MSKTVRLFRGDYTGTGNVVQIFHSTIYVGVVGYLDFAIYSVDTILIYVSGIYCRNIEGTILDGSVAVKTDQTIRTIAKDGTTIKGNVLCTTCDCSPTDNGTVLIGNVRSV